MLTLNGRVAFITGGTRGIGFAIARAFASGGMDVAVLGSSDSSVKAASEALRRLRSSSLSLRCDVREEGVVQKALESVVDVFGGIDVVVNCAGILDHHSIQDSYGDHWNAVMDVNLRGAFNVSQKSIQYLEKSASARIINVASNAGRMGGFENGLAYTASKGGVIALTYGLARRLGVKGITVNCIAPGPIKTGMIDEYAKDAHARLFEKLIVKRLGLPEEVAAAACYFASEEAAFTTGAVLDVNGGLFMG